MSKKYIVTLSNTERNLLRNLISSGGTSAKKVTRACILLKSDQSEGREAWKCQAISNVLDVSRTTIARVRRVFLEEGLEATVNRRPTSPTRRPIKQYKLDKCQEAHLIALVRSEPPPGHDRWTLRLLAHKMVEMGYLDRVSHETVRRSLKMTRVADQRLKVTLSR